MGKIHCSVYAFDTGRGEGRLRERSSPALTSAFVSHPSADTSAELQLHASSANTVAERLSKNAPCRRLGQPCCLRSERGAQAQRCSARKRSAPAGTGLGWIAAAVTRATLQTLSTSSRFTQGLCLSFQLATQSSMSMNWRTRSHPDGTGACLVSGRYIISALRHLKNFGLSPWNSLARSACATGAVQSSWSKLANWARLNSYFKSQDYHDDRTGVFMVLELPPNWPLCSPGIFQISARSD